MSDNLARDYAKSIARGFYDADAGAPFGYRDDADTAADTLGDVLEAAGIPDAERDDYDAENLPDGWRVASALDYVADALDIRYVVASDRTFRDGEVCISFGGPTAWISTDDAVVHVAWGGTATESIPYAVRDAIRDALEELWEMGE